MHKALDELLVKTFPNLYADRYAPVTSTAMCWGFDCGDGWFLIIWNLSKKLEKLIVENHLNDEYAPAASQVKEKFGTLRFYLTCGSDEMFDAVDKAEEASASTCEECGHPGESRDGGWIRTLCDRCHEKQNA